MALWSVKLAQLGSRPVKIRWLASSQHTARKPSKQHVEDSPQGSAESSLGFPASFKPTKEFYDTQEAFGIIFSCKSQASPGLAGRNLEEIRLHELSRQEWQNYNLRALTQGRCVSMNLTSSIKEATFISYLLQHLREHKLNLDQIAVDRSSSFLRNP